ncbi:MAG TPA: thiolase family protein [Ramlibacter sp.]|nr:thiolase family protein [Ramlibacter sp.]
MPSSSRPYNLRGQVAVVGIGETPQGRLPGKTSYDLYVDAAEQAIKDAGLKKSQIDGLITQGSFITPHQRHHLIVADRLGLGPRRYNEFSMMGGCAAGYIRHAMNVVANGMCDYMLLVGADNLLTNAERTGALQSMMGIHDLEFVEPYGNLPASNMAMMVRRHMHEYGWTSEQFAEVAVTLRHHASLTPGAFHQKPITREEVLSSRMISDPFRLLDCSIVTDGGVALILTSAERAKDLPHKPVYAMGEGGLFTSYYTPGFPDLVDYPRWMLSTVAKEAFAKAGIAPTDVDVIGLPDVFTGVVPIVLEGCGFCDKGEGGEFVASGAIRLGGRYPINTHGGNHSYSHPGNPGQTFNATELVRQLRGKEGARQVKDAEIGFLYSFGGTMAQHSAVVFSNQPN